MRIREGRGRRAPARAAIEPRALSARGAVLHLIRHGLLDAAEVVRGHVSALDLSSRHRNVAVLRPDGTGFQVKQGATARGAAAVRHEGAVLRLLAAGPPALARRVPRLVADHPNAGVLVLASAPGARSLRSYGGGRTPPHVAAELGGALAALHRIPLAACRRPAAGRRPPNGTERPLFEGRPPWVLSLHRPAADDLGTLSAANFELIRLLQSRVDLCAALDRLRRRWRIGALLHNDLRWENCLVAPPTPEARPRLLIVDWELADVGDPAWDLGSVLAQWLSALGAPPLQAPLARRGSASEDVTIAHVRAASRAFWDSYCERAGADDETAGRLLRASIRCAGARLVQIGYEEQQAAVRLRPRTRVLVGLAGDVLLRPERTAGALLGSAPWATGSFAPPLPRGRAFAA